VDGKMKIVFNNRRSKMIKLVDIKSNEAIRGVASLISDLNQIAYRTSIQGVDISVYREARLESDRTAFASGAIVEILELDKKN
jgi:hypothetical protein